MYIVLLSSCMQAIAYLIPKRTAHLDPGERRVSEDLEANNREPMGLKYEFSPNHFTYYLDMSPAKGKLPHFRS